jgi:hypothetical protein
MREIETKGEAGVKVKTGPIGAFAAPHNDSATDAALIQYVSAFVPTMSGENYNPHASTRVAPKEYLDQTLAEPFEPFTFSPQVRLFLPARAVRHGSKET